MNLDRGSRGIPRRHPSGGKCLTAVPLALLSTVVAMAIHPRQVWRDRYPADGGQPPNRTVAAITVEVRVFYPPGTDPSDLDGYLNEVGNSASQMWWADLRPE